MAVRRLDPGWVGSRIGKMPWDAQFGRGVYYESEEGGGTDRIVVVAAKLLLLVILANGAPLVLNVLLGRRWAAPLDGGARLADGRPLLGESKTVRGVAAGLALPTACAPLMGLTVDVGLTVGGLAMLGDLATSFLKRRLDLAPSTNVPLLDQLPECLLPLLALRARFALSWLIVLELVAIFVIINLALTPVARVLRRRISASR